MRCQAAGQICVEVFGPFVAASASIAIAAAGPAQQYTSGGALGVIESENRGQGLHRSDEAFVRLLLLLLLECGSAEA